MDTSTLKEINSKLDNLNHILQNYIILQLVEKGLGREDIRKIVKSLNNAEYSTIYRAFKNSVHGER